MSGFVDGFLAESREVLERLDREAIEALAHGLAAVREGGGRLFVLGVGGSAAHASHAVNDFRKLCDLEAYAPTDNVAELTARTNDDGWRDAFTGWLRVSRLGPRDAVLVFSVGGGDRERGISENLVATVDLAREAGARVFGIVGRDGGHTRRRADACVVVPTVADERVTPHTEATCAVVWHLLVSHPALRRQATKWESATGHAPSPAPRPRPAAAPASAVVVGGAGFIGSHVVDRLLAEGATVTVLDDLSSGTRRHLAAHDGNPRLALAVGDAADVDTSTAVFSGHEVVVHLASNPDIALAALDPDLDFRRGTALTRGVAEAARRSGVRRVVYASGSGVYGDLGARTVGEGHGPLEPVSTYGASKLAGEALLSAYAHLCGIEVRVLRFGNVVGPRQTHGVGYDFVRKLRRDPRRLDVLGDGSQTKPYLHVADAVEAMWTTLAAPGPFATYNVAPEDGVSVREIAGLAIAACGLDATAVEVVFGDAPRGWKGDVPVVRLDSSRLRALGWSTRWTSREAVAEALAALVREHDARGGEAA